MPPLDHAETKRRQRVSQMEKYGRRKRPDTTFLVTTLSTTLHVCSLEVSHRR